MPVYENSNLLNIQCSSTHTCSILTVRTWCIRCHVQYSIPYNIQKHFITVNWSFIHYTTLSKELYFIRNSENEETCKRRELGIACTWYGITATFQCTSNRHMLFSIAPSWPCCAHPLCFGIFRNNKIEVMTRGTFTFLTGLPADAALWFMCTRLQEWLECNFISSLWKTWKGKLK